MKIFSCMETTQGAIGSPTIQPKDENCTLTLQTYNKKFIKKVEWEIIDIILSKTPNRDLSHGPKGGYGVVLFLKYKNNWKSIVFDLCQCETGVQMEDNEGGIGKKEVVNVLVVAEFQL